MSYKTIGISADSLWLECAYASERKESNEIECQPLGGYDSIPSAILLPRIEGEAFRFDLGSTAHPRGSGLQWPIEARVDTITGRGRLPIGLILDHIGSKNTVSWRPQDDVLEYSCSDALASSLASLYPSFDGSLIFVVPNHWNVGQQQTVLDSFQRENLKCKLLWRPIAAAMEWTHKFRDQLANLQPESTDSFGKLLTIYVGYSDIEITELELVNWANQAGRQGVVPGRRRPSKEERLPGFAFRQLISKLSTEIPTLRNPLLDSSDRMGCIWNQLWCSQNLRRYLSDFRFTRTVSAKVDQELESRICSTPQVDPLDLSQRLLQLRKKIQRRYSGIVAFGPLVSSRLDDGISITGLLLDSLDTSSGMTLVEGTDAPNGVIARGAYRFAKRLEQGLPTYLDTLPRLEMVILEKGEPTWIDLLEPEQKWVEGGKEWRRPERVGNMSIASSSIDLKLAIAHEDFDDVREVVTGIPSITKTTERVSLSVQMTPAQGNARIEIHPENQNLFGKQRVFIDWKHMTDYLTDTGERCNKEGYLNSYPRIFPELLPRLSSRRKMQLAQPYLVGIYEAMESGMKVHAVNKRLDQAKDLLREKDQSMYPRDATAFDSDGNCHGSFKLANFMKVAWPYYLQNPSFQFVRAMAYTHVDHKKFHELIVNRIKEPYVDEEFVLAAGKCLRTPSHTSTFATSFLYQLGRGRAKLTWWKALAELLRFRGDATQLISSDDCTAIIRGAGEVFQRERMGQSGNMVFRTVCMVIVYTLRRRAFDDTFLPPESELARWVKDEFRRARVDSKSGNLHLMGGSVNLPAQLQLIIDYVDRKGKGQLLIGE
jgi:hypothetical protein